MSFFRIPERWRRLLLPICAGVLSAFVFLVFRPMGQRCAELDQPLEQAAQDLAFAQGQSTIGLLDSVHIEQELRETQRSLEALQDTAARLARRIELRAEIRARLQAPFQLFDYQYERQIEIDDLTRLAEQHQVKLDPGLLAGFPQHTVDTRTPALLWAKLEFLHHLAATAIQNKVTVIHALGAPSSMSDPAGASASERLTAVPLYIELTGSMSNLSRFLRSLPLRAEEVQGAGLPPLAATKPPLFIDRLFLVKQSPLQPDEVRLSLQVAGFVERESQVLRLPYEPVAMWMTLLRSRAFALGVHAVLWALLLICLVNLGSVPPQFVEVDLSSATVDSPVPMARITNLFSSASGLGHRGDTNLENPFATQHFIPPIVPPPPAPTTRQAQATYHGYYQTGDGPILAFFTVDQKTVTGPVGSVVAKPWTIAVISATAVTLTNAAAGTILIPFNKTVPIELPVP